MDVRGGTVPLLLSYRRVTKKPQIKRTRRFVGLRGIARNLAIKAIEFVQEVCYEIESEVLDAGEEQVVHWALEVDDPWGVNDRSTIVACRTHGEERPAAGVSVEIVTFRPEVAGDDEDVVRPTTTPQPTAHAPAARRGPEQEAVRARMRKALQAEMGSQQPSGGNGTPHGRIL